LTPSLAQSADPPSNAPVATNIAGAVIVRSTTGGRHDLVTNQVLRPGDVIVTSLNSLAMVSLADVGRVLLGPRTMARTYANGSRLDVQIETGSVCVQSQKPAIAVDAGRLTIAAVAPAGAIFDLAHDAQGTQVAVYSGEVTAAGAGQRPLSLRAGNAARADGTSVAQSVPIRSVNDQFTDLHCPDEALVAQVVPPTDAPQVSSGGGGGGGILAILLGLGALAAAAGHGGGGGGGNGGTATTPPVNNPSPSPRPSPSPSPSVLPSPSVVPSPSVLPSILPSVLPSPSAAPSPSPSPSPLPSPSPSPSPSAQGQLTVAPNSLTFSSPSAPSQGFTISETGFSGDFDLRTHHCGGVASLSGGPFFGPSALVTVTPQGAGTCRVDVSDGQGGNSSVSITVQNGNRQRAR